MFIIEKLPPENYLDIALIEFADNIEVLIYITGMAAVIIRYGFHKNYDETY